MSHFRNTECHAQTQNVKVKNASDFNEQLKETERQATDEG